MAMKIQEDPNVLQASLDAAIAEQTSPAALLTVILERKLRRQGIRLTSREQQRLRAAAATYLETNDLNVLSKAVRRKRNIRIVLGSRDLRWAKSFISSVVGKAAPRLALSLAKSLNPKCQRWATLENKWRGTTNAGFRKRLARSWKKPFADYARFCSLATEIGELAVHRLDSQGFLNCGHLAKALVLLHARACLVAREIEALIHAGFADGAEARWRTLHEISVTSVFLIEHGESTAEKYLTHFDCEQYRAARIYQQYRRKLGYRPLGRQFLRSLKAQSDALVTRHGAGFDRDYGWASVALNRSRTNFAEIEHSVKLAFMRPFFRLASEQVHAGSRGALRRSGMIKRNVRTIELLVGPTNYGFADAAMNSAHALLITTASLLHIEPTLDTNVMTMILVDWEGNLRQSFVAAQDRIERSPGYRLG